jgi:hypothetical protein
MKVQKKGRRENHPGVELAVIDWEVDKGQV